MTPKSTPRWVLIGGFILAVIAGGINPVGLLSVHRQALSHMTGNITWVGLDLVGGDYFPEDLKSLAILGRVVLVGLTAGRTAEIDLGAVLQKRARVFGTVLRPRSIAEKAAATDAFARDVLPLLADGRVRPNLDRTFPLTDVREAYSYLASNKSFGKVVLELSTDN